MHKRAGQCGDSRIPSGKNLLRGVLHTFWLFEASGLQGFVCLFLTGWKFQAQPERLRRGLQVFRGFWQLGETHERNWTETSPEDGICPWKGSGEECSRYCQCVWWFSINWGFGGEVGFLKELPPSGGFTFLLVFLPVIRALW